MTYRILWKDAAGEGRFGDFEAENEAEAAWKAAQEADSQAAEFVELVEL